jgi:hypothetical protein
MYRVHWSIHRNLSSLAALNCWRRQQYKSHCMMLPNIEANYETLLLIKINHGHSLSPSQLACVPEKTNNYNLIVCFVNVGCVKTSQWRNVERSRIHLRVPCNSIDLFKFSVSFKVIKFILPFTFFHPITFYFFPWPLAKVSQNNEKICHRYILFLQQYCRRQQTSEIWCEDLLYIFTRPRQAID